MDEITQIHELNLEWGSITKLLDKISEIEDTIDGGWPELIDMIVDAVSEEDQNKSDSATLFFSLYQYLFRLYYRLKRNPEKRRFNVISKERDLGEDVFVIKNYDYSMFKWARANGCGDLITNDYVKIPVAKLTDKQRRAFERRAEKYPQ